MVSFLAQAYAALVTAACLFGTSSAAPAGATDVVERKVAASQAAPHFVLYADDNSPPGPPDVSQIKVRKLAFMFLMTCD